MLPCPCCEEAWIYVSEEYEYKSKCMCGLAYRSLPWAATKDEAKENWNRLVNELNRIIPKIIRKHRNQNYLLVAIVLEKNWMVKDENYYEKSVDFF